MSSLSYSQITGTISEITSYEKNCCHQLISINTAYGPASIVLSPNTYVAENETLCPGMTITAFYDTNQPVPLIYPPRYQAVAIAALKDDETVALHYFNNNLVASDDSLVLNLSESTIIKTANGQYYNCKPGGNILLVYYHTTTRSIPPQTTPHKIIVFCQY